MLELRDGANENVDAFERFDAADIQQHAFIFGNANKFLGFVFRNGIKTSGVHAGRDHLNFFRGRVV